MRLWRAEQRRATAIALESCVMAAIHRDTFANLATKHQDEDVALQASLVQLMEGQYDIYGTSPDLQVQASRCLPCANG